MSTKTMSRSRLSRCATEVKISRGDLVQRVEQEVHRPVGLSRPDSPAQPSMATRSADPPGGGQLADPGSQGALGDQGEHHPLDGAPRPAGAGRDLADRRADPEPLPQPVQRPRPAQAAGVQHLDLAAPGRGGGLLRGRGSGRSRRPAGPARRGRPGRPARSCGSPWRPRSRSAGAAGCAPTAGSAPPSRPGWSADSPAGT